MDKRLQECIELAKLRRGLSISFRQWCEEQGKNYHNYMKLVRIGDLELEQEGAGLARLNELRARTRNQQQKFRDRKKAKGEKIKRKSSSSYIPVKNKKKPGVKPGTPSPLKGKKYKERPDGKKYKIKPKVDKRSLIQRIIED